MLQTINSNLHRIPLTFQFIAVATVVYLIFRVITRDRPFPGIPVVTLDTELEGFQRWLPRGYQFARQGTRIIDKGLRDHPDRCFQVCTFMGYRVIAPPRFTTELTMNPALSHISVSAREYFPDYPGFEKFHQESKNETILPDLIRINFTQNVHLIIPYLIQECDYAIRKVLHQDEAWHTYSVKGLSLDVVSRLASRVLVGSDLCRNEEWLQIGKADATNFYTGAQQLRLFPAITRPIVHWFIPTCKELRRGTKTAEHLIMQELEQRRKQAEAAVLVSEKAPNASDGIGWIYELLQQGRQIDCVAAQLVLSLAAIHTTAVALTYSLLQLCDTPELVQPLRDEVIGILRRDGWTKKSLYKMRLVDSFLKEVMRVWNLSKANLIRVATEDVTLSDGTTLPANSRIMISSEAAVDPAIFPDPHRFDMYRFFRLREKPGDENRHQFANASPDLIGWGYGHHVCPGRFYASDQLKIALAFLLLQYDFRHIPGQENQPKSIQRGLQQYVPVSTKIQMRRRPVEIDLTSPKENIVN